MRFGSYFSGGGLADVGARMAKFTPVFGVEGDPSNWEQSMRIADCYEENVGRHLIRKPIQEINPADLPLVDWFHASPVCKSFSNANNKGEKDIDVITAKAVADYINHHRPQWVTIENVWGYRNSPNAWPLLASTLMRLRYGVQVEHLNAANFGVPQTRKRMIVRASADGRVLPPLPHTHTKTPIGGWWNPLPKWVPWYEAIHDLIPSLEDSEFAPWQLRVLPDWFTTSFLMPGSSFGSARPHQHREPSFTVLAAHHKGIPRAFLMNEGNPNGNEKKYRDQHQPAKTVTTNNGSMRAFEGGRVVSLNDRCLMRFQTEPDDYRLPDKFSDSITLIGNGVPCLLMQRIGEAWRA